MCEDKTIKTIYTEIATETYDAHIKYDDIINLEKEKLILMRFDTVELYKKAVSAGFEVACIEGSEANE